MSMLMPGLGHISCGKIKRGIILYLILQILSVAVLIISFKLPQPYNIALIAIALVSVYLFIIIDSIVIAKNPNNTLKLKPLIGYSIIVGILIMNSYAIAPALRSAVKNNIIETFHIPSGAMIPTLLIGDYILVDKIVYKKNAPQRGDIIILKYPKEPQRIFIKRIIALGGDEIEIINKKVYINDNYLDEPFIIHSDPETNQPPRDDFGPFIVPENSYFVMGDNRDQSFDSRFWGVINRKDIKGKAINLYFSWNKETNEVRWERIGMLLN